MGLIDADALIKAIDPMYRAKRDIVADTFAQGCMQFEKLIKQQPTAYDVNKVIEQLEETFDKWGLDDDKKSIMREIVKKGGEE